jgi:acyl-CoA synthetase (AMP-forming)/AMP-acid ligase II
VRITDDDGRPMAAGEEGEICIGPRRGPWADVYRPMLGYHRRPAATRLALRDGYVRTGDVGWLDDDGNLFVTDRKSSLILRGGANVYPAEVERVLAELPGVAHVSVVGLPDLRLGQRVAAAVERGQGPAVTEDDVIEHGRAILARYKVPEVVRFVPELPRNAMGKVVRRDVERLLAAAVAGSPSRKDAHADAR